jgi:hypothetical protein
VQQVNRPSAAVFRSAFDIAVLLALRERELGIPSDAAFERARGLAERVIPDAGIAPGLRVELAELAPAETSAFDPDIAAARNTRQRRERLAALRAQFHTSPSPSLVEAYVRLAFDCDDREIRQQLAPGPLLTQYRNHTLIRYRLALCGFGARDGFTRLRDADARWVETAFFEGRSAAAARPPNLRGAIDFFVPARTAFPESPAIALGLAHAYRGYGDLEPALESYDAVLDAVPTNREALLGRVITLSYLERHTEAIATATRMIDLGTWLMGRCLLLARAKPVHPQDARGSVG